MLNKVSKKLTVSGLLLAWITLCPFSLAQNPYWDNSSGSGSYYTPPSTSSGQNYGGTGSYNQYNNQYDNSGQSGYGQSNTNQNYGQPNYSPYGPSTSQYGTQSGQYGAPSSQYGSGSNNYYNQNQPALRGYISTAPPGTNMSVTTTTYLSSANSRIGDPVSVTLGYDLAMGGSVILPAGTMVQGEVTSSVPAGRTGRHGQLQLRFNRAMLPDGRQIPLSARLVTEDGTGIIRGGTRMNRVGGVAKNTLGGAAIGAATGTAMGALIGGKKKWDEGLMWGSILGAGGGLVRSGFDRGDEAELQPGTQLQIMLDQPLTTSTGGGSSAPYGSGGYPY